MVEFLRSERVKISQGMRQGCILSPLLFNLYSDAIFREALHESPEGIVANGSPINNLRYTDDTILVASNMKDLQNLIDKVVFYSGESGLTMNIKKTLWMLITKKKTTTTEGLKIGENFIERVASFKYLGTNVNEERNLKKEIHSRIAQARMAYINMNRFFNNTRLDLELRMRMVRAYVFSVLLYGCECWTLDPCSEKKLEAFEMYLYRRLLCISWVQKVRSTDVLTRMNKERELLTVKIRKTQYFGHIMTGPKYEILRLIIEGKIKGKRSIGRRQNSWLKDMRRWFGCSSNHIFRTAVSRVRLAIWIANLRKETAR